MHKLTTVEADPEGAASFLRALKAQEKKESVDEDADWFHISSDEVQEKLGKGTIWDEPPIHRGRAYEVLRRANIGGNYPIIDDVNSEAHTATSMKTLDLTTGPYQDLGLIESSVRGYMDHLGEYSSDVDRYLEIGIPAGKANPGQRNKLRELQEVAGEQGIRLVIGEVP